MIVKFEKKSERIKGLSFHPKRPWLLAGLHTGNIQLWDYRLGQVIDNFMEHEGPVRQVHFHPTLALFVSGSDDLTVRVWNYKTKKCLFILRGHLDFVRCVNFHPELPWVISGSDDQTARIWNYQSRQMIAIMTGHTHYVMQCQFHPTQDLLITCSLDQTIRLWSITQLKKQFTSAKFELTNQLELVQILEGHNQGVNYCSFHPTQNLIVSASDDKKIKVWKYNDTRCWEVQSFEGHTNNVCSVIFHPKADVLISNSEDKTQRVWDLKKKIEVDSFTNRENDRFWVVAAHPDNYYFAGGSDSALYIFTLYKDRPPMELINQNMLCIGYQKSIKVIDIKSGQEKLLRCLSDLPSISDNILQDNIEQLQINQYDNTKTQIMVRLKQNQHNKTKQTSKFVIYEQQTNNTQLFLGKSATFVGKTRIVRSKESGELELYNYDNDLHTGLGFKSDKVFPYPGDKIVFYEDHRLIILDPLLNQILFKDQCTEEFAKIKKVVYNQSLMAIQTKKSIYVFSKELKRITQVTEKIPTKSVLWLSETQNIIIYSTKAHLKYLLMNGDNGILKSTENIVYLVQVQQPVDKSSNFKVICMDNQWQMQTLTIDVQELLFKQSLFEKNTKSINQYLNNKISGDSLVSYLYQKQYASLAINLVTDKKAKFQLAIGSNNLEAAYKISTDFKDRKIQSSLYEEAQRQGNHNVMEISLQNLREYDKLVNLYAILGQADKQARIMPILQQKNNLNSLFQNALYTGKLDARIQNINGLSSLCELQKQIHKLPYGKMLINPEDCDWVMEQNPEILLPPTPVCTSQQAAANWPHNFITEADIMIINAASDQKITQEINESQQKNTLIDQSSKSAQKTENLQEEEEFHDCEWGIDEDTLIEPLVDVSKSSKTQQSNLDLFTIKYGFNQQKTSSISEMVRTEQYENCIQTLEKSISLTNQSTVISHLKELALSTTLEISPVPFMNAHPILLQQEQLHKIKLLTKQGYKLTTEGKFNEVLQIFRKVIQLSILEPQQEQIQIAVNYIIAMKCELAKKGQTIARQIELACYMATCDLQPAHRVLTLRSAMSLAYKNKNFLTAAQLAKQLIKIAKAEVVETANKILKSCEQQGANEHNINFDEKYLEKGIHNLCSQTLTIQKKLSQCRLDQSGNQKDAICGVCDMCMIVI